MALSYYADEIIPYLTQTSKESLEIEKTPDEDTGKSDFVKELNKAWSKALREAKSDMEDIIGERPTNKK